MGGDLTIFNIISKLYEEGVMISPPRALIWHDSRCILSQLSKIYLVYGWGSQTFSRLTPTCIIMQGVGMTTVALVWHVNQCTLSCPLRIYMVYGGGFSPFSWYSPNCLMKGVKMTPQALVWYVNQCTLSWPLRIYIVYRWWPQPF